MTRALAPVVLALAACTPPPSLDTITVHAASPEAAVRAAGWTILAQASPGCWSAVHRRSAPDAVPVYGTPCATCAGDTCTVTDTVH